MIGSFGDSLLLSPVNWEYGRHIHIGDGVFINFECVFLDGAEVRIGDGTAVAPRVQFLTAGHRCSKRSSAALEVMSTEAVIIWMSETFTCPLP